MKDEETNMSENVESALHFERLRTGNLKEGELLEIYDLYCRSKTNLGRSILHEMAISSFTPVGLLTLLTDYEDQMVRDAAKVNLIKHKSIELRQKELPPVKMQDNKKIGQQAQDENKNKKIKKRKK